jgi:hypothetical protein
MGEMIRPDVENGAAYHLTGCRTIDTVLLSEAEQGPIQIMVTVCINCDGHEEVDPELTR